MKLTINELHFNYSSEAILENVNFELEPGELVSIIGPNGAGKSTLIKCINRILEPEGIIKIGEKDTKKMNRNEMAKHMSYVPQSPENQFPTTVLDTVLMGRRPHCSWRYSDNDINKALYSLELMGISDFALKDYNELSGGQQQRVIIARAIAQESNIVLLDEPTSNLDIKHQLSLMELLKELVQNKGISVIMAIHDLNISARYSDRLILMEKGKIVAAGEPADVLTEENIEEVYGVKISVREENGSLYIIPLRSL